MLSLGALVLSPLDEAELQALQNFVNNAGDYQARVADAAARFAAKPAPLFRRIREALSHEAGDLVRCGYCEDSCADEVEHVKPKAFFPEEAFYSQNYLFACGPCNTAKHNKFAVRSAKGRVDLVEFRKANGLTQPPHRSDLIHRSSDGKPVRLYMAGPSGGHVHI